MNLYKENDYEILKNNIKNLNDKLDEKRLKVLEPNIDEIEKVFKIITKFIIEKKLKIYGGYAIDLLIKDKNPKDAIYNNSINDIDIYSPNPIKDIISLCNELNKEGFKFIMAREAMHMETYTLMVNTKIYCDFSYVPINIYNKIPFILLKDFRVTHPHFLIIDYFRIFCDPLISYWRFDDDLKAFKRFFLIQKYYPINNQSTLPNLNLNKVSNEVDTVMQYVYEFLFNRKTIITIGATAYNIYLNKSGLYGIYNSKNNKIKFDYLNIPFIEFISIDYVNDFNDLKTFLENKFKLKDLSSLGLTFKEFYPFFQFIGFRVELFYKNTDKILIMYDHNKICYPYLDLNPISFKDWKINPKDTKKTLKVGSFHLILLYFFVSMIRYRTDDLRELKNNFYNMIIYFIEMRNIYLDKNKKDFINNDLFKDFVIDCMGETIMPERKRKLLIENRRKNKKRFSFVYEPSEGIKEPVSSYKFLNSSGNEIIKTKNLKLLGGLGGKEIIEEEEED